MVLLMCRIRQAVLYGFALVANIALIAGCATIYTSPDFVVHVANHETIAVLPFDVTLKLGHAGENVTEEELQEMATQQGRAFQRALYTQFLQGQQKGKFTVTFQDIHQTNVLLSRELEQHPTLDDLSELTKSEICNILGVDAVVSGEMALSKPVKAVGRGAAIVSTVLMGVGTASNEGRINMSIHEGSESKLLWNYEHRVRGKMLSSPESVAKDLMNGAARTFPYRRFL